MIKKKPVRAKRVTKKRKKRLSINGINDILPKDSKRWSRIFETGLKVSHLHDFLFVKTPSFEKFSIFEKANKKDNLLRDEPFVVSYKKEKLILGMGGIASIARSYTEHQLGRFISPLKAFLYQPVYRKKENGIQESYECVFGILGDSDSFYDGEIVLAVLDFFKQMKLRNGFDFKINMLGCRVCRPGYLRDLKDYCKKKKKGLCGKCADLLKSGDWKKALECKEEGCIESRREAPIILDRLCNNCNSHFQAFLELIEGKDIVYKLDPFIMGGENYYNRSFFEIVEPDGKLLAQGGRCDYLFENVFSRSLPAVEARIFLDNLIETMKEREESRKKRKEVFFIAVGEEPKKKGLKVIDSLRQQDIKVTEFLGKRSLEGQLKSARRAGGRLVLILGQKELFEDVIILRDLNTGNQETVRIDRLGDEIKKRIK